MKFFFKNLKLTLKIISWIQILGGIFGLGLMAYLLLTTGDITGPVLLIFLFGISLFIFSIHCGIKLLSPVTVKYGLVISLINQGLQFIQWSILGYGLSYSSPIQLLIGFKGASLDFNLSLTSIFNMSINSGSDFILKINLVAIFLFIVLSEAYRIIKKDENPEVLTVEMEESDQPTE